MPRTLSALEKCLQLALPSFEQTEFQDPYLTTYPACIHSNNQNSGHYLFRQGYTHVIIFHLTTTFL